MKFISTFQLYLASFSKNSHNGFISCVAGLVFTIFSSATAFSQSPRNTKLELFISGGVLLPGWVQGSYELYFPYDQTVDIRNAVSPLSTLGVDYAITRLFSFGLNINYASFRMGDVFYEGTSIMEGEEMYLGTWDGREHNVPYEGIYMLEVNPSVKIRILLGDHLTIKPCLYLGYRRTFCESPDARESGVVLNLDFESQYYISERFFLKADLGMLSQPYGGVKHVCYVRSFGVPFVSFGLGAGIH